MSKEAKLYLPQILWYIAIWSVVATCLFFLLRYRYPRLYTKEKYEYLISTVSRSRQKAVDPCQFSIFGDPVTSEGNFAKVTFYCDKNKVANNSMDLTVLPENSYSALLKETARINGFSAEMIIKPPSSNGFDEIMWKCFDDQERITNFFEKVKIRSRVECFNNYSDAEIRAFYEKK